MTAEPTKLVSSETQTCGSDFLCQLAQTSVSEQSTSRMMITCVFDLQDLDFHEQDNLQYHEFGIEKGRL